MIARGIGLFFTSALLTGFIWMMPVTEVKTRCDYSPAEAIAAAYVQVNGDAGTGSGVCVGEYVVTARHVTEASDEVTLKRGDEDQMHTVIGDVIFQSDEADLAVIKPRYPVHGSQPATLSTTPLARGETVWYCGTTIGIHGCIEKSIVNLPKYTKDKHSYFAVNGGGWYGNSGGGCYVIRDGKPVLVGILVRLIKCDHKSPVLCETGAAIEKCLSQCKGTK